MPEAAGLPDFNSLVVEHARKDFPLLDSDMTISEALERIRREGVGERVIYFFAVDSGQRLVGVLPTRRLLTAAPETQLRDVMVRRVVAIPATATILDACEFFVLYKFFAFPVVDDQRRVVGVVDVSLFAEEILGEREEQARPAAPIRDDVFEVLGFHLEQIRGASPWRVFRFRFPWLLVTVTGGTICAILAGAFEATLAKSLVVAFFLTMVLGLNESVSAQSMSVTIQMLRSAPVTWSWFRTALRREFVTAVLIGFACGTVVAAIVFVWRHDVLGAFTIGGSIALSLVSASLFGLGVPSLLHRFNLDPKIAAGPVTLALADICALILYFTTARLVL
ncbi:MAG TPA: magnesium transporter [Chthoniobacterales bacterium]|nr:magnesium transporter [Chthoniobacterales bacterium]